MTDVIILTAGYIASAASIASFAPQAWKIIKTKDTSSISLIMYIITVIGFLFWIVYGIGISQWPIIITNSICLLLSSFILFMKCAPQSDKNKIARALDPAQDS